MPQNWAVSTVTRDAIRHPIYPRLLRLGPGGRVGPGVRP